MRQREPVPGITLDKTRDADDQTGFNEAVRLRAVRSPRAIRRFAAVPDPGHY